MHLTPDELAIITPDDLPCDEVADCGTFDCSCGCDPDRNICFLDAVGVERVTHLRCRVCGRLSEYRREYG